MSLETLSLAGPEEVNHRMPGPRGKELWAAWLGVGVLMEADCRTDAEALGPTAAGRGVLLSTGVTLEEVSSQSSLQMRTQSGCRLPTAL